MIKKMLVLLTTMLVSSLLFCAYAADVIEMTESVIFVDSVNQTITLPYGTYQITDGHSIDLPAKVFKESYGLTDEHLEHIYVGEVYCGFSHPHDAFMFCTFCGHARYTGDTHTRYSCSTCHPSCDFSNMLDSWGHPDHTALYACTFSGSCNEEAACPQTLLLQFDCDCLPEDCQHLYTILTDIYAEHDDIGGGHFQGTYCNDICGKQLSATFSKIDGCFYCCDHLETEIVASEEHTLDLGHYGEEICTLCSVTMGNPYVILDTCCIEPCTGEHNYEQLPYFHEGNTHYDDWICGMCGSSLSNAYTSYPGCPDCEILACAHNGLQTSVSAVHDLENKGHQQTQTCADCPMNISTYVTVDTCCIEPCTKEHNLSEILEVEHLASDSHNIVYGCSAEGCKDTIVSFDHIYVEECTVCFPECGHTDTYYSISDIHIFGPDDTNSGHAKTLMCADCGEAVSDEGYVTLTTCCLEPCNGTHMTIEVVKEHISDTKHRIHKSCERSLCYYFESVDEESTTKRSDCEQCVCVHANRFDGQTDPEHSASGHKTFESCTACGVEIPTGYTYTTECCISPCSGEHTNTETNYFSANVHRIERVCEVCEEVEDIACDDTSCNICSCVHAFTREVNISPDHTQSYGHLCDIYCDSCNARIRQNEYTVLSSCCISPCIKPHTKVEENYHSGNAHYVNYTCSAEGCDYEENGVLYTANSGFYPGCTDCTPCTNGHSMSLKNYHFGDAHYTQNQCTTANCNYVEAEVIYSGEYPDCFSCNSSDGKECSENYAYDSNGNLVNLQHLYDIVDNFHEGGNHFVTYECSKCLEQYNVKLELKFAGCSECGCTHPTNTEGPCYACEFFNESNPENSKILYPFAQVLCSSDCATTCKYYNKLHCVPKTVSTGYEERWGKFHYALDIYKYDSTGSNVTNQYDLVAPFCGTVLACYFSSTRGNCIIIEYSPEKDENGVIINDEKIIDPLSRQRIVIMYMHMDTLPAFEKGNSVEKGTVLAKAGATGISYSNGQLSDKAYHLDITIITNNLNYVHNSGSSLTQLNSVDPRLLFDEVFNS